ncbi:homologous-pairing protein 2 homolog [Amphibalanus amphitrite]|uniref:homologous-pairing protein 2 homolog n=1 Tax=Amphibalanus amphitrite TaxID=1232801 RepID=UPI001C918B93|nr:homologous-pairing protein 2 homolog [Amphibalanus amphitrite]XP_043240573.1 homologous-pairing protein 2 homolog [Amphibalanus amphitrite]XP_043240580.1 homologous-pairing protein 2 homolog [Amphibalanus amphitrite]XP_043240589.1 homologous-pairing protein 2 homolog [Amphibalanus amphitrite]XP_043240600.1 homologous-pairing protein 2 homolog [Amphibalanus amphitrite]XP_043240611.1 homologous-pairing protein 2 homolog [Amphibalanus amphitrite]XP_043240621.1 homologous-pairing protein 2 hom
MADKTSSSVFKYLHDQNRPYSVTDIHMNLHKEYGKTAVQKSLDALVEEKKVMEKVYGKQKVYVVNQELFPKAEEAEIKGMDAKIAELTAQLTEEAVAARELEARLKATTNSLTSEQAKRELKQCEQDVASRTGKLAALKRLSGNVTADERRRVQERHRRLVTEWRKRKRIATDIVDAIMEGYPKKKKDLLEEIGLETDEEAGVTLPK